MADTPTVLIVDDSKFVASMLGHRIYGELGFKAEWRGTYAEAVDAIDSNKDSYLVALIDLNLSDAPNGEIVEYARTRGLPVIIFTDNLDKDVRRRFLKWNVVDYTLKNSNASLDTLLETIGRIHKNRSVKVLVVEDSKVFRDSVSRVLAVQLYQVLHASNGEEALDILAANPDIKLIVTDYDMPGMDGLELIRQVRETYSRNKLAIMGMSASDEELLSARLLKIGANDFVPKPFQVEEFVSRVSNAVETLEHIELIRDLSYVDSLTRLHNRRYFFENADIFIHRAIQDGLSYSVGMIDIDHFKTVNDTYGHSGGDVVLQKISTVTSEVFAENAIVSRFGGEEFCVLAAHAPHVKAVSMFDALRSAVEETSMEVEGNTLSVTVSIGVASEPGAVEAMLKLADSRLYTAKETGRNKVVGPHPNPNVRDR